MARRYSPGGGICCAICCFGITADLMYEIAFKPKHDSVGSIVEGLLLTAFILAGLIFGKLIYRSIVRNIGEERAQILDLKIYKTTIVVVVIAALLVVWKYQ